jgi:hypothetical protein
MDSLRGVAYVSAVSQLAPVLSELWRDFGSIDAAYTTRVVDVTSIASLKSRISALATDVASVCSAYNVAMHDAAVAADAADPRRGERLDSGGPGHARAHESSESGDPTQGSPQPGSVNLVRRMRSHTVLGHSTSINQLLPGAMGGRGRSGSGRSSTGAGGSAIAQHPLGVHPCAALCGVLSTWITVVTAAATAAAATRAATAAAATRATTAEQPQAAVVFGDFLPATYARAEVDDEEATEGDDDDDDDDGASSEARPDSPTVPRVVTATAKPATDTSEDHSIEAWCPQWLRLPRELTGYVWVMFFFFFFFFFFFLPRNCNSKKNEPSHHEDTLLESAALRRARIGTEAAVGVGGREPLGG